jgi:hypothetical protein
MMVENSHTAFKCMSQTIPLLARNVSAGTHPLFPELGVDRLCHQPAGHGRP